jgi:hypothetical protein
MLKKTSNRINPQIQKLQRELDKIPKKAHAHFKKITPIDTGNARRRTKFENRNTIAGNYDYANRLNTGWSKQARDGMTDPTIEYIRSLVKRITR